MTDEEAKVVEAFQQCANVRLPDDFADRLVKRIREDKAKEAQKSSFKTAFTRIVLIAASLTLLLGFAPNVFDRPSAGRPEKVAHVDEIRSVNHALPQDSQLDALAILGLCREVVRRRVRTFLVRLRKREEYD